MKKLHVTSMSRLGTLAVLVVCALYMAIAQTTFAAGCGPYKFANKTGKQAHDLHIVFEGAVQFDPGSNSPPDPTYENPKDTFHAGNAVTDAKKNPPTTTVDLAKGDATANGVPNNNSVTLWFCWSGDNPPKVVLARWTATPNGLGTLTPVGNPTKNGEDGNYIGDPLTPVKGVQNSWAMAPAAGTGYIVVTIDGTPHDFYSTAGDNGNTTAQKFAAFIGAIPLGSVLSVSNNLVIYTGNVFGTDSNITVTVSSQDSTQPVTVTEFLITEEAVPTVSEWGMIIMTALLLTGGAVVIWRRAKLVPA